MVKIIFVGMPMALPDIHAEAWKIGELPVYALNLTIPPLTAALLLTTLTLALLWSIASRRHRQRRHSQTPATASPPTQLPLAFMDEIPLLVCAFDTQGLLVFWNRECERLSGLAAAETVANLQICARLFPERLHPRSWIEAVQDLPLTDRDGQGRLIRWHRLTDSQSAWPIWLYGYDATAIRLLQQELSRCHRSLREIFSDLGRSLYIIDARQRITLSNLAAAEGHNCHEVIFATNKACEPCPAREVFATGQSRNFKRERAGRYEDVTLIPIFDGDHRIEFVAEIIEDLTERQLAERERRLLERHQRQDQKLEALATLAGGLAHDFNNTLAAINGYAELLSCRELEPDRIVQYAAQISQAAQRAKSLVSQVLMFSRKNQAEPRAITMAPLIRETVASLEADLPAGVEFSLDIAANEAQIWADPYQLHQLIKSLCENAIQSTSSGSISIELVSAHGELPAGDCVRLRISDTGSGMDQATLARIFDPFFSTRGMGRGLGLAMAHSIVENLGGEISVKSQPEQGSCFTVYLPTMATASQLAAVSCEPCGHGENIMVIDSQSEALDQACDQLKRLGYNVTGLSESATAFKLLESHPESFAAVIADVGQPQDCGQWLASPRSNPTCRSCWPAATPTAWIPSCSRTWASPAYSTSP